MNKKALTDQRRFITNENSADDTGRRDETKGAMTIARNETIRTIAAITGDTSAFLR